MAKNKESETFVEIGGYLYKDEGRVRTALHVGDVNRILQPDDAAETIRLKKIRVTLNVSEDSSVQKNKVYEKDIEMIQEVVGESSMKSGKGSDAYNKDATPNTSGLPGTSPSNGELPAWGKVMKNMLDEGFRSLRNDKTAQWIVMVGIAVVAAVALGLAVVG